MPVTLRRQKKKEKEKEKTTIADHGPLEHAIQDPRVSRLCTDDVCVTVAVNLLPTFWRWPEGAEGLEDSLLPWLELKMKQHE